MGAFGKLVRSKRRAADLTQAQVAKAAGVTQSFVAQWETDDALPASLSTVRRVADLLKVSQSALFDAIEADQERRKVAEETGGVDPKMAAGFRRPDTRPATQRGAASKGRGRKGE